MPRHLPRGHWRRVGEGRNAAAELGDGLLLDVGDELTHHAVEHRDLRFVSGRCRYKEEVGDAAENFGALFDRGVAECRLDLFHQRYS